MILTRPISLALFALALALPAGVAAQSANDFQLPPNPSPTPTGPVVQGPVDEEAPVPATPRAIPTETPRPVITRTPTPTPTTAAPTPTATRPVPRMAPSPRLSPTPTRATPRPVQSPATTLAPAPAPATPPVAPPISTSAAPSSDTLPGFSSEVPSGDTSSGDAPTVVAGEESGVFPWPWLMALALLVAAIAGFLFWRSRQGATAAPGLIQPPRTSAPVGDLGGGGPSAATAPRKWITVEARAVELRRSMMNATLSYRITIANRSGRALERVVIEADLATAHGKAPVEQQLASPAVALTERERPDRLAPGERMEMTGEIILPLNQVKVIRQGNAVLAVPLLRVRVTHPDHDPQARTWVIGLKSLGPSNETGGRLRPFRFDAPPQTYTAIAQRPLD